MLMKRLKIVAVVVVLALGFVLQTHYLSSYPQPVLFGDPGAYYIVGQKLQQAVTRLLSGEELGVVFESVQGLLLFRRGRIGVRIHRLPEPAQHSLFPHGIERLQYPREPEVFFSRVATLPLVLGGARRSGLRFRLSAVLRSNRSPVSRSDHRMFVGVVGISISSRSSGEEQARDVRRWTHADRGAFHSPAALQLRAALVHNSDRGRELAWPRLPSSDHLAIRHPERRHGVENLAPDPCLDSLCRQPSRSHR